MAESGTKTEPTLQPVADAAAAAPKKARGRPRKNKKPTSDEKVRKRVVRPYPAMSFEESLPLAVAIQTFAAGQKVRRLMLCDKMKRSPTSSATQNLITNSAKYGITVGSFVAEHISLTEDGAIATNPNSVEPEKLAARFRLAVEHVGAFKALYEEYKGKRLPAHEIMRDRLLELDPRSATQKNASTSSS
jgi:hypothetical protein